MRVQFRPTIASDIAAIDRPLPVRIKAITAVLDGRVLGIGGLGYEGNRVIAFVHMKEEARKYPAAIHRAGLLAMQMIRASGEPVVITTAEPGNPAAVRWLQRLGFREVQNQRGEVTGFIWRQNQEKAG